MRWTENKFLEIAGRRHIGGPKIAAAKKICTVFAT